MKPKFKVIAPVEREGKTYWVKSGVAFVNKDDSINIILDVLPKDGKLQLRNFDEESRAPGVANDRLSSSYGRTTPAAAADGVPF